MNIVYVNLQKDICYLYHVQSHFNELMSDLDFNNEFSLEYWSELNSFSNEDEAFVKNGCMILILLMTLDKINGSGDSLTDVYNSCYDAVQLVTPFSESELKLKNLVLSILSKSNTKESISKNDENLLSWVYSEFVEGYFKSAISI